MQSSATTASSPAAARGGSRSARPDGPPAASTSRRQNSSSDSDSSSSEDGDEDEDEQEAWEDWVDDDADVNAAPTMSLFDKDGKMLDGPEAALAYDRDTHGCDIVNVVSRLALDFHQIIRLINYIRTTKASPAEINELRADALCLQDDTFLNPVIPDDPLLQLDIEELAQAQQPSTSSAHPDGHAIAQQATIQALQEQLSLTQQAYLAQKEAMEKHFQNSFGGAGLADGRDATAHGPVAGKGKKRDDDTHYFNSYSQNEIHEIMIKDRVRTESYRNFILQNPSVFKDAVVLDVGCGTGILSMFAAQAGAKKVYAVDASEVAYKAMRNVKENGLDGTVEVIKGKIEEIGDRIQGKVDVIVSEWMGYFLLYEAMLDSVLVARDLYLRPGGLLVPSQCSILLAGIQDAEYLSESIDFWDDVYGLKMSAMKDDISKEADIRVVPGDRVISSVAGIKDVIMSKDTPKDSDFSSGFSLRITRSGRSKLHGLIGWFDTFFTSDGRSMPSLALEQASSSGSSGAEVAFSTSPRATPTHWKQTVFWLSEAVDVKEGDEVKGTFSCRKAKDNSRELEVEVVYTVGESGKQRMQAWAVA